MSRYDILKKFPSMSFLKNVDIVFKALLTEKEYFVKIAIRF